MKDKFMKSGVSLCLHLLFMLGGGQILSAQSLEEILEAHYKAIGSSRFEGIKNMYVKGSIRIPEENFSIPFQSFYKRPYKLKTESRIEGVQVVQAFDGEKGWLINPMAGSKNATELGPEELAAFKIQADFEGPLYNYVEKGHDVELLGKDTLHGNEVFHLLLKQESGQQIHYYLETKNFLIIQSEYTSAYKGVPVTHTTRYSNFRPLKGVVMPRRMRIENPYQRVLVDIQQLTFNAQINDRIFEQPETSRESGK